MVGIQVMKAHTWCRDSQLALLQLRNPPGRKRRGIALTADLHEQPLGPSALVHAERYSFAERHLSGGYTVP